MRKPSIVLALTVLLSTAASAQAPDPCLSNREYVKGGLGTAPYSASSVPTKISVEEFAKTPFIKVVKTAADLPSTTNPKSRLAGIEQTLYELEGYVSCGLWYGPGGSLRLQLDLSQASFASNVTFGYTGSGCRLDSPNDPAIQTVEKWIINRGMPVGASGCGVMAAWVRIRGYGFWLDNGAVAAEVKPAIFPVVDIVRLDGPGGDPVGGGGDGSGGGGEPPAPPPPPPFQVSFGGLSAQGVFLANGTSHSEPLTTYAGSAFSSTLRLNASCDASEGDQFSVSVSPETIEAPGNGDATLTILTGPMTFPRQYLVTVTATAEDGQTRSALLPVSIVCDPPVILGVDQPVAAIGPNGTDFTLSAKAGGSLPQFYQWYEGHAGLTLKPIPGATQRDLNVRVNGATRYWARISNACGSADSLAALVSTPELAATGPVRRRTGR